MSALSTSVGGNISPLLTDDEVVVSFRMDRFFSIELAGTSMLALVSRRRVGIIAGTVVIAGLAGCAAYFFLVLRLCGEVRDVRRGSLDYRLCGVGSELIARIPIVAPASEALYSWTLADGTKPGRNVLKYESVAPPSTVRTTIAQFLRQTRFFEKSADSDYEWWTDRHTELGLSIRGASSGSHVEILHNTGSD